MKIAAKVLAFAVLTLAGQTCFAQNREAPQQPVAGWYAGTGIGSSRTSFTKADFTLTPPQAGTTETQDTSKTGAKAYAGYDFTKNWAIEGAYAILGTPEYKYVRVTAGATNGQDSYKARAWSLAGKGTLPLNNRFDIFAKLGVTSNKSESNSSLGGVTTSNQSASNTRAGILAGIGAAYHIDRNISVRLEYESYGKFGNQVTQNVATPLSGETGRASVALWSVGIAYKF